MTPGVGLNTWKDIGLLNREIKPYVEYARRGWKVKILTYDKDAIPELPEGIETIRFPSPYFLWFLHLTHENLGKWADVIKTNQSNWAIFYTHAARFWKKPILLRCGYVQGEYLETTMGFTPKVKLYQCLEARAFREATYCQLPTEELSVWVQKRYEVSQEKILVIPNFVDTDIFKPIEGIQKKAKSIISVGRLSRVKQFDLLIRACAEIPGCTVTIVGEGSDRQKLERLAKDLKVSLNLPGNQPNEELPTMLQEHEIFVITSKREGHPKALIEAMACGMPCIGSKVRGIENVIKHERNGLIVELNKEDIKNGILKLGENKELSYKLGRTARQYVEEKYSFLKCFAEEYKIIKSLI